MTTLFLVNRVSELTPDQTTTGLIVESAKRQETWVAQADGLESGGGRIRVQAVAIRDEASLATPWQTGAWNTRDLESFDAILVRLNPGRDPRPWLAPWLLDLLDEVEGRGVHVHNRPGGLRRFGSKTGLRCLPEELVPQTLITTDHSTLETFVRGRPRAVLKPVSGTQGRGVFILGPDDPNVSTVIETLTAQGPVVAQEWLPQATDGDQRIMILDGEVLHRKGHPAIVRRRPRGHELRSNVHLGAIPEAGTYGEAEQALVAACGPILARAGIRLAGLDCIGGKVIEANVWSPGGLSDMARLQGLAEGTFYSAVLDAFR